VPHGGAFKIIIVETSTAMTNRGRVYNSGHSMSRKNTLQRDYATAKEGENDPEAYVQPKHPQEARACEGEGQQAAEVA
jgi:hypothetical protein